MKTKTKHFLKINPQTYLVAAFVAPILLIQLAPAQADYLGPRKITRLEFKNHPGTNRHIDAGQHIGTDQLACKNNTQQIEKQQQRQIAHQRQLEKQRTARVCKQSKKRHPQAAASLWRRATKNLADKWQDFRKTKTKPTQMDTMARQSTDLADNLSDNTGGLFSSLNAKALNDVPTQGREDEISNLQISLTHNDVVYVTGQSSHDRQALLNGVLQDLNKRKKAGPLREGIKNLDNLQIVSLNTSLKPFKDLDELKKELEHVWESLQPGDNVVLHIQNPHPFMSAKPTTSNLNLDTYIATLQQEFRTHMANRSSKLSIVIEAKPGAVNMLQAAGPHAVKNTAIVEAKAISQLQAKKYLNNLARSLEKTQADKGQPILFSKDVLDFISQKAQRYYGHLGHPGGAYYIMQSLIQRRPAFLDLMEEGRTTFGKKLEVKLDEAQDLLRRVDDALAEAAQDDYKPKFALNKQPELIKKIEDLSSQLEKDTQYVRKMLQARPIIQKIDDLAKQIKQQNPDLSPDKAREMLKDRLNQTELEDYAQASQTYQQVTHQEVALFLEFERKDTLDNLLATAKKMTIAEKLKLFKQKVFGQPQAAEKIADALGALSNPIMSESKRAKRVMLFVGPSGVGKTESARAAHQVQDIGFIKENMAEYAQESATTKLTGSDPGFVGESVVTLAQKIYEKPRSVIVIDEFEKAHPSVRQAFLGALDDGLLEDRVKGITASLDESIVIITSNLGQDAVKPGMTKDEIKFHMRASADAHSNVSEELFTRIQDVVVFKKLGIPELNQIIGRDLKKFNTTVLNQQLVNFSMDQNSRSVLSQYVQDTTAGSGREMMNETTRVIEKVNRLLSSGDGVYEVAGEYRKLNFRPGDEIAIKIKPIKGDPRPVLDEAGQPIVEDGVPKMQDSIKDVEVSFTVVTP